ncbi:hypothetical protein SUGI_0918280 [Cryptomeria japonica]|uniref:probable polyamine oxidase 5 n=1 Tax=Cryptomeria japonica TaxID=3369 RepID=UPI002414BD10|nr:probable polyamine oxidase 5 [Cryptomeria japonica]GLJ44033.1 hypothetical protein SUGI_0918280 [Cryptomeria japonica]
MVARKPRIVIIGAGMAGLTAANRLVRSAGDCSLVVVEASHRIGGRINTTEFDGNRVELGATWIHGIGGSPVHKIAQGMDSLIDHDMPWERMDGFPEDTVVKAEGGATVDPSVVQSISQLYKGLMDVAQERACEGKEAQMAREAVKRAARNEDGELSIGAFVRQGLECYWAEQDESHYNADGNGNGNGNAFWNQKLVEEGVFSIHENTERTYTSAGSLLDLDFEAEKEYREFPGEQITIGKGYSTVLKALASVLPAATIQFGKKVSQIQWTDGEEIWSESTPVRIHFEDGSFMDADHVIITVSLGVLKAGTGKSKPALFTPPLPSCKVNAISKLGFGVVNKLFLKVDSLHQGVIYPFLQFIFSKSGGLEKKSKAPWWMRKTVSLCPIYRTSNVLLAWFAGEEALELECLSDEEIIKGVSDTLVSFGVRDNDDGKENRVSNGTDNCISESEAKEKINGVFSGVLKSGWGFDPLFRGSYSYVAVGSSGQDIDTLSEPLPKRSSQPLIPPLQLLFAGEATHRTHYSTTHGAYFSGLREANRLLQHYGWTNLERL